MTDPRALRLGKWKCGCYSALEYKGHQEMISERLAVAREGMGCLSKLVMKERMSFSPLARKVLAIDALQATVLGPGFLTSLEPNGE